MADRAFLQLGDEIHCVKCGQWHPTSCHVPDQNAGSAAGLDRWLWFTCPRAVGEFYGGVIGQPPQVEPWWRRPARAT